MTYGIDRAEGRTAAMDRAGRLERIEPLLPQHPRRLRNPGRRRVPDRQVLCGILFVLYTAIQWEFLPVRREALCDRVGVRDLRCWPVAAG